MNAKRYLLQVKTLDTIISRLDREIERARNELVTLKSSWPDGQPHGSGGKSDPVGEKAAKLADLIAGIEEEQMVKRAQLWKARSEIVVTISKVEDPVLQEILNSHYVDGKTFEQVAVDIGYSWRHTIRKHGEALAVIDRILKTCH